MLEIQSELKGSDLVRLNAGNPTTNAAGLVHEQHFSYQNQIKMFQPGACR